MQLPKVEHHTLNWTWNVGILVLGNYSKPFLNCPCGLLLDMKLKFVFYDGPPFQYLWCILRICSNVVLLKQIFILQCWVCASGAKCIEQTSDDIYDLQHKIQDPVCTPWIVLIFHNWYMIFIKAGEISCAFLHWNVNPSILFITNLSKLYDTIDWFICTINDCKILCVMLLPFVCIYDKNVVNKIIQDYLCTEIYITTLCMTVDIVARIHMPTVSITVVLISSVG